jgi:Ca2+-binding RTX toxin-like protein
MEAVVVDDRDATQDGTITRGAFRSRKIGRAARLCLLLPLAFLAAPVAAQAANVTVANGTLTFNAGAGETNTAVIVKQQSTPVATVYFAGDQNPNVTVTASAAQGCLPTPAALGLPKGFLCTVTAVTPITSVVENLGDQNDTGVIGLGAGDPHGNINGGAGDDTLVGGRENDTFRGNGGTDNVAYVGISDAGITRTVRVIAALPPGATASTGNGQTGESDAIAADVEDLTGGNGPDILTGNGGPNTIAGAAPPGTPDVNPQPPNTESRDIINGGGGADTLLAGDSGTVNGQDGDDTIVGGRSFANTTNVNGGNGDDTIVSGTGSDDLAGGAGSDTLAYASVDQAGLSIVKRTHGVLVRLPEPGTTGTGGTISGQEKDVIHDDIRTLIGSNNDDVLIGSNIADTILGAAPVGTGNGVVDTPAGNDAIFGRGGDDSIVGGDRGQLGGGEGNDTIVGGRSFAGSNRTVIHGNEGNDTIISGLGSDEIFGDDGSNTLAYASVQQQGLNIVDRGTNGVTAVLPNAGQTATGGRTGGQEKDIIHSDISTLVGGNGNDVLVGNNLANTLVGVAPAGTEGVKPGPAGNDVLAGLAGNDLLFGAEGNDIEFGGPDNDVLLGVGGNDIMIGETGVDNYNAGDGGDNVFSRDGVAEAIVCGAGTDQLTADATDLTPAGDCENVSATP